MTSLALGKKMISAMGDVFETNESEPLGSFGRADAGVSGGLRGGGFGILIILDTDFVPFTHYATGCRANVRYSTLGIVHSVCRPSPISR